MCANDGTKKYTKSYRQEYLRNNKIEWNKAKVIKFEH